MDHWYAECLPCRWEETHDTEGAAISAAEQHVIDAHRDLFTLNGVERSRKMVDERIGHVQLRGENTIGAGVSTGAVLAVAPAPPVFIDQELQREARMLEAPTPRVADLRKKKEAATKEQRQGRSDTQ